VNQSIDSSSSSSSTANTEPAGATTAQALPQAKEITTFDVLTEIQLGNNDTVVALFTVHCDPLTRYGCYWLPGMILCGFIPHFAGFTQGDEGIDEGTDWGYEYLKGYEEMRAYKDAVKGGEYAREGRVEDGIAGEEVLVASPA
jgi:hypothetical protein